MAYDEAFFEQYKKYLQEPTVRRSHDLAFGMFNRFLGGEWQHYVDLGCGTAEFWNYYLWKLGDYYCGIDTEIRVDESMPKSSHMSLVQADYRMPRVAVYKPPYRPTAFVSLFSIEPVLDVAARYELYCQLFEENPALKFGLSAGFYYESKRDQETVGETGGIVSYQTIDELGANKIPGVEEIRLVLQTPSEMFGPDVVEVWKMFRRT